MNTKRFFILFIVLFAFAALVIPVSAQDGDRDGDGIPDRLDRCVSEPGPRETMGCPVRVDVMPDRDGDGVADFVDLCPDEAGTGFTNGCPVSVNPNLGIRPETTPIPYLEWVTEDYCVVGVPENAEQGVNVRDGIPQSANEINAIIGVLQPGEQFAVAFADEDYLGETWYFGALNAGWVKASVVIENGACFDLRSAPPATTCTLMLKTDVFEDTNILPLPVEGFSDTYLIAHPGEFLFSADVWLIDEGGTLWYGDGYFWVRASDVVDINGVCDDEESFNAPEPMPDDYYDNVYPDSLIQWLANRGYAREDFPTNQAFDIVIDPSILMLPTATPGS